MGEVDGIEGDGFFRVQGSIGFRGSLCSGFIRFRGSRFKGFMGSVRVPEGHGRTERRT
jgi:hypothetical protein